MTKYLFILTSFIAWNGCANDNSTYIKSNRKKEVSGKTNLLEDTVNIKKWLTKVITDYVNKKDLNAADKNLQKILTASYYEYKIEAITLEYSEMTKEEFQTKWKSKYDTRFVGKGGFFTSVMDNGNIEIAQCKLLKTFGDTAKVFYTVVHDLQWNQDYKFDIKIICKNNKLLIDDVKEYE
ncbi:MAG: hypothetical protein K9H61_09835 [Bacteroidia bacterium]|nr:hypothetical protein [Bacteroidia bacterium]MCF8427881.1 hypothetical protein [Bacteroidia bacterium]MCF8447282.1 hypothetical protein [Bacteroidia bacterium]